MRCEEPHPVGKRELLEPPVSNRIIQPADSALHESLRIGHLADETYKKHN